MRLAVGIRKYWLMEGDGEPEIPIDNSRKDVLLPDNAEVWIAVQQMTGAYGLPAEKIKQEVKS